MARTQFDDAYYRRFYRDPRRRVGSEASTARLVAFVASYLAHLDVKVKSVLDLGCGLGWWRAPVAEHFTDARWIGVERSEHLCRELGWKQGSVVDWPGAPCDLVVCQGVLQYLDRGDCERALANLARLSRKALYVEIVTREDWDRVLDRERSDTEIALRPASFYRRALGRDFVSCGGGLFVKKDECVLFAMEEGASARR
jgi:trans-aconitate methyltransferase